MADGNVSIKFTAKDMFSRVSRKLNKSLEMTRKSFAGLDTQMKRTARNSERTARKMDRSFGKLGKVAGGLFAVGTAKRVMGAGLGSAAEMQRLVARVLQNVRDPAERKRLGPEFRKLIESEAARSGLSRGEIGQGLFDQISAAGAGAESLQDFKDAVETAVASTANLSDVIVGINKVQENFDLKRGGGRQIGMALVAAQAFGITDVGQISAALPQVAGSAAAFNITPTQLIATMAAASKRLGSTAEGTTAIRIAGRAAA